MGCGKSSTGRRVARALGYTFADTDCLVEETAGKSIARIFAEEGETVFRQLETEALAAIPQEGNTVVATGGGLPCSERNLSLMRQRGRIVYLASSQERLVHILLACRRDRRPPDSGTRRGRHPRVCPHRPRPTGKLLCAGRPDGYLRRHGHPTYCRRNHRLRPLAGGAPITAPLRTEKRYADTALRANCRIAATVSQPRPGAGHLPQKTRHHPGRNRRRRPSGSAGQTHRFPDEKRQRRQRCALLVALRICWTHNSRHPIQITSGTTPRHRTCRAPSDDKYLSGHAANACAACHAVIIKIAGGRQSPLPAFQNHAVNRQAARPHNAPSPQSVRRIRRDPTEGTNTPPGHRNASERDNGRPFPTACNDRRFPGTTHA